MATQCNDVDTLLPTYLDGELAPHDQLAFEHHLADCGSCRETVNGERAYLDAVRARLAPPAPPADLAARVRRALDDEDRRVSQARRRWSWSWALPGGAGLAAAAALVLFVTGELSHQAAPAAESAAVREVVADRLDDAAIRRGSPAEISVAANERLRMPVSLPRFSPVVDEASLKGWQPREVEGRQAVTLLYENVPDPRGGLHQLRVHLFDARNQSLDGGEPVFVLGKELRVGRPFGVSSVWFKDASGIGWVFSSDMALRDLVQLVGASDLLYKLNDSLRGR
ncbi:MAG TPA: zf-HC2 domain-containing protein [Kofleriaceae bacterium]|nr:zf-HC2 domain-containing protein [Kofleriaceae bacterium]